MTRAWMTFAVSEQPQYKAILHISEGGKVNKRGRQQKSHGESGRIKVEDGGRAQSPSVQLR